MDNSGIHDWVPCSSQAVGLTQTRQRCPLLQQSWSLRASFAGTSNRPTHTRTAVAGWAAHRKRSDLVIGGWPQVPVVRARELLARGVSFANRSNLSANRFRLRRTAQPRRNIHADLRRRPTHRRCSNGRWARNAAAHADSEGEYIILLGNTWSHRRTSQQRDLCCGGPPRLRHPGLLHG
jgi:hypothetical protein